MQVKLTLIQERALRYFATGDPMEMGRSRASETTYSRLRQLGLIQRSETFPFHVATPDGLRWLAAADNAADVTEYAARQRRQFYGWYGPFAVEAYDHEVEGLRKLPALGEFATIQEAVEVVRWGGQRVLQAALALDPTFTMSGLVWVTNHIGRRVWPEGGHDALTREMELALEPVLPLDTPSANLLDSEAIPMIELVQHQNEAHTPKEKKMTTTLANRTGKTLKACACSLFQVEKATDVADGDLVRTGCARQTNRQFAQGHDAKLVSFLVAADIEDRLMMVDGLADNFNSAEEILRATFGEALAEKARKATVNALDKAARARTPKAKATPAAPREVGVKVSKATEVPAPAERTPEVAATAIKGKVGRWIYEGFENTDGAFMYRTSGGENKRAEAGKWTKVA